MKKAVSVLAAVPLGACASIAGSNNEPIRVSVVESDLRSYVIDNWPDFERRFRWSSKVDQGALEFVSIDDVKCYSDVGVIFCNFLATANTADGEPVSARIGGTFGYFDGRLGETIIVV
jgi:hypothetical protein